MKDSNDKGEFFRLGMSENYGLNTSLQSGVPSTQFYWSISNGNISAFMRELDLLRNPNFNYYNLDERAYLNALASVKYYTIEHDNQTAVIPYGYEKVGTYYVNEEYVEKKCAEKEKELGRELTDKERESVKKQHAEIYDVYKTDLTLPLGYTYSEYFTQEEYDAMSSEDKQEAMLNAVMLQDNAEKIKKSELKLNNNSKDYEITCGDNVRLEDGKFIVDKKFASEIGRAHV